MSRPSHSTTCAFAHQTGSFSALQLSCSPFFNPTTICLNHPLPITHPRYTTAKTAQLTMKLPWETEPLNKPVKQHKGVSTNNKLAGIDKDIASNDAVAISTQLKGAIQRMYARYITEKGVDYESMGNSKEFDEYLIAASKLPSLDVEKALVDDNSKIAFYVNLYNATTQHGIIKRGPPPSSSIGRLQWGMKTIYKVGKYKLSLHEIENGILRRNKRISVIPPPFVNPLDSRRKLCVKEMDPRIHFVLNCAANSCPPVLFLTVDNLQDTLQIATKGFLSNKDNFYVDKENNVVHLSMIFNWYKADFAPDKSDVSLLKFIEQNGDTHDENIMHLSDAINRDNPEVEIQYLSYDWALNDSN